jgi:hypothetical protein
MVVKSCHMLKAGCWAFKPSPDYSRRPEQDRATGCRNSANATNKKLQLVRGESVSKRSKFRQRKRLLVPAYELANNPG